MDIEQHGARGVGGVGAVDLAAGQTPEQEAVYGAETQLIALGARACARHIVQNPAQLGCGEVGVDQQSGALADHRLMAGGLEFGTVAGGAAILPDNGAIEQLAAGGVPHQGGFALVGDADPGYLAGADAGFFQHLAADRER